MSATVQVVVCGWFVGIEQGSAPGLVTFVTPDGELWDDFDRVDYSLDEFIEFWDETLRP